MSGSSENSGCSTWGTIILIILVVFIFSGSCSSNSDKPKASTNATSQTTTTNVATQATTPKNTYAQDDEKLDSTVITDSDSKDDSKSTSTSEKEEETIQTGWQKQKSKWIYLDNDGERCTGWQSINSAWYYFNKNGIMQTGWIQDKGTWYYLGTDGAMQTNTTVDGWWLDDQGRGTEIPPEPLPANGEILSGYNYGNAGVEVTASNANVFVKVKTLSGDTVASFFVRKNSTAQIYVDPGTYSVQFASGGDTWYGTSECFGSNTSYGQDKSVSLGYGDIICYTLKLSTNGNFSMQALNPNDF